VVLSQQEIFVVRLVTTGWIPCVWVSDVDNTGRAGLKGRVARGNF